MNRYQSIAYGLLGPFAEQSRITPDLQRRLQRAHMPMRAAAWLATLYLTAILVGLVGAGAGAAVALLSPGGSILLLIALVPLFGVVSGGIVFSVGPLWLQNTATNKAKEIDENLPHALNYMLALANAGLPPKEIWGALSEAKVFGPIAFEADRIHRDLDILGYDILKALRLAQDRTPSKRWHEFLQGAISAFQSGVELEAYLKTKGQQYQHAAEEEMLKSLDTMGVMAEAFLVSVVAAPLFLIILLTVMAINQGGETMQYGYLLVFVFIPVAQVVIGALIRAMTPKVWT